jgi:hypothetical protein
MSAVVFDINGEYDKLPGATIFNPGSNLKFRLDRIEPRSFLEVIQRLAPFAERTAFPATAAMRKLFEDRKTNRKPLDIQFLKNQADIVLPGTESYIKNMSASYVQSLEILETFNLFATEQEIHDEDQAIKQGLTTPATTLSSTFYGLDQQQQAGVVVFAIGGLLPNLQRAIVKLVLDGLKHICDRQSKEFEKNPTHTPIYPTVFFEEAHMYMDEQDINELIPLIRHLGMNLFFITNTPGNLPDSVFRLLDNLFMNRMLNEADIKRVVSCGLADKETIESFAPELPEFHALVLSAKDGVTRNFPLVFKVRDFGLPLSGVTRSMWRALDTNAGVVSPAPGQTDASVASTIASDAG